ncbi:MAG: hypothetical protein HBSAPP02_22000 [Phycisphaerae bacterium]|nr:MAG: hypothetical protein HRU71_05965 [Planctomycetia bacterium]GJQ27168.1 MAG: hypothetical protein HBSAPP02_22000 [Phycisphaerae bacterium]
MNTPPAPSHASLPTAQGLSDLPRDELVRYGRQLGLELDPDLPTGSLVASIRTRQELLIELERDALLDIVVWARRPVRRSASKEELAREIARIERTNYNSLPLRGLVALARLRGLPASPNENAHDVIDRLKKAEGLLKRFIRKRRQWVTSLMTKLIAGAEEPDEGDYQFLPEEGSELTRVTLKQQIEQHGIVGGIASRLRGAADDYIKVKLDEIEQRIDAKLLEIDQRLAEWRDREVANRLKILRITLVFSALVAAISLGYKWLADRTLPGPIKDSPPAAVAPNSAESTPTNR